MTFAPGGYMPTKYPQTVELGYHTESDRWYVMPWREHGPQDWVIRLTTENEYMKPKE